MNQWLAEMHKNIKRIIKMWKDNMSNIVKKYKIYETDIPEKYIKQIYWYNSKEKIYV